MVAIKDMKRKKSVYVKGQNKKRVQYNFVAAQDNSNREGKLPLDEI